MGRLSFSYCGYRLWRHSSSTLVCTHACNCTTFSWVSPGLHYWLLLLVPDATAVDYSSWSWKCSIERSTMREVGCKIQQTSIFMSTLTMIMKAYLVRMRRPPLIFFLHTSSTVGWTTISMTMNFSNLILNVAAAWRLLMRILLPTNNWSCYRRKTVDLAFLGRNFRFQGCNGAYKSTQSMCQESTSSHEDVYKLSARSHKKQQSYHNFSDFKICEHASSLHARSYTEHSWWNQVANYYRWSKKYSRSSSVGAILIRKKGEIFPILGDVHILWWKRNVDSLRNGMDYVSVEFHCHSLMAKVARQVTS